MIELPEAVVIAEQITHDLKGRRVVRCQRGQSPHKFVWYGEMAPEEYESTMVGLTVGDAIGDGNTIIADMNPDHALLLGEGGLRIVHLPADAKLPKKHQLLCELDDGTYLVVSVSGWGRVALVRKEDIPDDRYLGKPHISPLSKGFTLELFMGLFGTPEEERRKSIKYFIISEPGIWGIGNGCLQDILYYAQVHPRRQVATLTDDEKRALYTSIRETLQRIVDRGGRATDKDLHGNPGGYKRVLHTKSPGTPCPACGTAIEKQQYLGGAIYFCPACQRQE